MLINERKIRHEAAMEIARRMMVAARTAPKGKGVDIIEAAAATDEEIRLLSGKMKEIAQETGMHFFLRDAENILSAEVVVLIGTRQQVQGLDCAYCGFPTCARKPQETPCAINAIDVGIAVGSACSVAANSRADTRVMFSAGMLMISSCSAVSSEAASQVGRSPHEVPDAAASSRSESSAAPEGSAGCRSFVFSSNKNRILSSRSEPATAKKRFCFWQYIQRRNIPS